MNVTILACYVSFDDFVSIDINLVAIVFFTHNSCPVVISDFLGKCILWSEMKDIWIGLVIYKI